MKSKLCLIPFIPALLFVVFVKFVNSSGIFGENLFGLNDVQSSYLTIGVVVALFVLCLIICLCDRQTAPLYKIKKNSIASIFAFLAGLASIVSGAILLMNYISSGDIQLFPFISALFYIPSAIAFIFIASYHMSGKTPPNSMGILVLMPALWACVKVIVTFLGFTTVSLRSQDMLLLISYVFLTFFFFSSSMVISKIKGRNPVKSTIFFGLPMIVAAAGYCTQKIVIIVRDLVEYGTFTLQSNMVTFVFLAMAIYALFFIFEIMFNAKKKDEITEIDEVAVDEYVESTKREKVAFDKKYKDRYDESYIPEGGIGMDQFVVGVDDDFDENYNVVEPNTPEATVLSSGDENENQEINKLGDNPKPFFKNEVKNDLRPEELVNEVSENVEQLNTGDFVVKNPQQPKAEFETRLDEIYKLIYEIQSKNDETHEEEN